MLLRPFAESDLPAYLTLCREFYGGSTASAVSAPEEYFVRTFNEAVKGSPHLEAWAVTEAPDAPMTGYLLMSLFWSAERGGLTAWLDELCISERLRGQGVGRWVLQEIREKYKSKVRRFRLEVNPENTRAAKLYREEGFEECPYVNYWLDVE